MEKRFKLIALVTAISSEIGDPQWVERETDHKVRLLDAPRTLTFFSFNCRKPILAEGYIRLFFAENFVLHTLIYTACGRKRVQHERLWLWKSDWEVRHENRL